MKLDKSEKNLLAWAKSDFKAQGGKFEYWPEYGATVAVLPYSKNSDFVQVATAYADLRDDEFKKKCGQFVTLHRLHNGHAIVVKRCERTEQEIAMDTLQLMCSTFI